MCLLCEEAGRRCVWLKLPEGPRAEWEGIKAEPARAEQYEGHTVSLWGLNFYSELNVKSLHDFNQKSDSVWPNLKWITIGSHVENRFMGQEDRLGDFWDNGDRDKSDSHGKVVKFWFYIEGTKKLSNLSKNTKLINGWIGNWMGNPLSKDTRLINDWIGNWLKKNSHT